MKRFVVNSTDENKIYGIYEYLKNGENRKCLGATNDEKCIFMYGIDDHFVQHSLYYDELGSKYNLWFIPYEGDNMYCLNINYIDRSHHGDEKTQLAKEQYDFMIGILKECQKYEEEFGKPIKVTATQRLLIDEEYEKVTQDIDSLISDIEEARELAYPPTPVKTKRKLFPWIKK